MYSDDEEQDGFPFGDLNASLYVQKPFPINLDQDSPQFVNFNQSRQIGTGTGGNSNNKNKYINRINAMMFEGNREHISDGTMLTPDKRFKAQAEDNAASQKFSDKLIKSRLSAKMSRQRKKLYMQLLETKVSNLQKQVQKSKQQLETTKGFLDKLVKQNQTISGFTASKHQTMKKLQSILERQNQADVNEINCIMDSLRYRIGANGRERVNTLNEYFKQIVNISFPALHRYMMWTASQGKHLFDSQYKDNDQLWFKQLFDNLGLSQEQKNEILSKKQQFTQQKDVLLSLINDLQTTKKKIEIKSCDLQDQVDVIRNILTPIQCAKFIIFIERNKYRKELNIWDRDSSNKKKTQEIIKKQQQYK